MTLLVTLRDIHLPALPLPVLLAGAACVMLLAAAIWGMLYYRRRAPLRAALRELVASSARHARDGDAARFAADLSQLLRRHALGRYPQADVAALMGEEWLDFLDAHGGGTGFRSGAGAVLAWLPYSREGTVDQDALVALVRRWLEANR